MGKPKFSRKKYETPSHPWQEDRIKAENELIKKYGLKNKREIWKAETKLRKYRGQARELLAKVGTEDTQSKKESDQLLMYLNRMNILPINSTLDDVLALGTESILSRRLQTLTYLKGLANTHDQARQIIGEKRVTVPGYMVTKDEDGEIGYTSDSPLNDIMHPARPRADFKSVPSKEEETKSKGPKEEVKDEPPTEEENPSEEKPEDAPKEDVPSEPEQKEEQPSEEPQKEETPPPETTTEEKPEEQPKDEPVGKENKEDKKEGD